jgi:hypothetical protein
MNKEIIHQASVYAEQSFIQPMNARGEVNQCLQDILCLMVTGNIVKLQRDISKQDF